MFDFADEDPNFTLTQQTCGYNSVIKKSYFVKALEDAFYEDKALESFSCIVLHRQTLFTCLPCARGRGAAETGCRC